MVVMSLVFSWIVYGYCFAKGYLDSLTFLPIPALACLAFCLVSIGINRYVCKSKIPA